MIKNPALREALDWAVHILIAVVIAIFIITFVGQRTVVNGASMEPTLHDGDNLIVEKISQRFGTLKPGDVVVVKLNDPALIEKEHDPIIKRIIAVENDTVEIKDGKVYVNGKEKVENYTTGEPTDPLNPVNSKLTVDKGNIYVMGDNRGNSKDSRVIGQVPISKVKGRAILRFFPFNKMGTIRK